jgi:NitT/TauT family transport system permease protein
VTANGSIFIDIFYTLSETIAGFLIGAAGGVVVGLALGRWRRVDAVLDPFLTFVNSMPRIALAPLFILWFGIGAVSKVILSVSLVFFIMAINTRAGLRNIERDWIVVTRLLGASVCDTYRHVLIPAATPMIFAGARLALVYSLLGAVVGELLSAEHGLGQQIAYYSGVFRVEAVLGFVVVLALMAVGLNAVLLAIEARVTRWERRGGAAGEL